MSPRPLTRAQERSLMAATMFRALSRRWRVELQLVRPLRAITGYLSSIERSCVPLIPVENGGSNLMLCFEGGEQVPLEQVTSVKRVPA